MCDKTTTYHSMWIYIVSQLKLMTFDATCNHVWPKYFKSSNVWKIEDHPYYTLVIHDLALVVVSHNVLTMCAYIYCPPSHAKIINHPWQPFQICRYTLPNLITHIMENDKTLYLCSHEFILLEHIANIFHLFQAKFFAMPTQ